MSETPSNKKIIENLKAEKKELEKELGEAKEFFGGLTIIKLPLAVKGKPAILLECLISRETADKIKELVEAEEPVKQDPLPNDIAPEPPAPETETVIVA